MTDDARHGPVGPEPTLEWFYREMLWIRRFEERAAELKRDGAIPGSLHLCIGQEAIPVGACAVLRSTDSVTATYRGHGWALAKGVPAAQMFAELMGRDSELNGGRGGSPYFSSIRHGFLGENSIVAAGMPIALGAAVAAWQRDEDHVSVVSIGDGAMNQGAAHESLNFAAAFSLPLVTVVENNLYSEMTPWDAMVAIDSLADRAAAYGMPGERVDGNDPSAVQEAIAHAVDRARSGGGPTLIECMTERLVGHHSGDVQHYRPKGEVDDAQRREPLVRLRRELVGRSGSEAEERVTAIEAEVNRGIEAALSRAVEVPEPNPETARDHVYVQ